MKIISNYKDYYDHLQGIYGIDEKIVYERVCKRLRFHTDKKNPNGKLISENIPLYKPEHIYMPPHLRDSQDKKNIVTEFQLAICGKYVIGFTFKGKYYFGDEGIINLRKETDNANIQWSIANNYIHAHLSDTANNDKYQSPVVLLKYDFYIENVSNVRLSDFGIPQVFSAHDIYIMLSNWLTREKAIVDNRTNTQKIVGHGFDNKTSFRHPIK